MRPEMFTPAAQESQERAQVMERVILAVRRLWFGAQMEDLGCAARLVEPGGEMLTLVSADQGRADRLVAEATERGCYVVVTDHTRPRDMAARLRLAGFRRVQRHGTYVYAPQYGDPVPSPAPREPRRGFLSRLWHRQFDVVVHQICEADLPVWNSVCWRAFESRVTEEASLAEKRQAFAGMGASARWYLATVNGVPAGTAILYQTDEATQVLAVGTLSAMRQRGVASAVMRRLIADWQATGSGFLFLDTAPGSQAERLYLKLGFQPAYVREVFVPGRLPFLTEG